MKLNILILLLGCISCSSDLMTGEYTSILPNKLQRMLMSSSANQGIATGVSLLLNPDSTYIYETCGIVTHGMFATKNDVLILNHNKIFKRTTEAALEQVSFEHFPFYQNPLQFEIKNQTLQGLWDGIVYRLKPK